MKKVKVKINGVWTETVAINGSTSGFSYQSWLNYVAVRNRTKTVVNQGDIDTSTLSVLYSAQFFYSRTLCTYIYADFRSINGDLCLQSCFANCANLTELNINLSALNTGTNTVANIFSATTTLIKITISGLFNSTLWSSTSALNNILAQTTLSTLTTLNFSVPILPNMYLAVLTSLNLASVVQVLGQLFDYSAGVAHTITFNRAFTGLSQSDYDLINNAKTVAVARNWTVAGLTYSM